MYHNDIRTWYSYSERDGQYRHVLHLNKQLHLVSPVTPVASFLVTGVHSRSKVRFQQSVVYQIPLYDALQCITVIRHRQSSALCLFCDSVFAL